MDIKEWELLPMEWNSGRVVILTRRSSIRSSLAVQPFGNSYSRMPNRLVPVSIHLDPLISSIQNQELKPEPAGMDSPILITEKATDTDQDMVSQVFFKKMKEHEFVDMKMDSPRSGSPPARGIIPQVDDEEGEYLATACSPRKKPWKEQHEVDCDGGAREEGMVAWERSKDGLTYGNGA